MQDLPSQGHGIGLPPDLVQNGLVGGEVLRGQQSWAASGVHEESAQVIERIEHMTLPVPAHPALGGGLVEESPGP